MLDKTQYAVTVWSKASFLPPRGAAASRRGLQTTMPPEPRFAATTAEVEDSALSPPARTQAENTQNRHLQSPPSLLSRGSRHRTAAKGTAGVRVTLTSLPARGSGWRANV